MSKEEKAVRHFPHFVPPLIRHTHIGLVHLANGFISLFCFLAANVFGLSLPAVRMTGRSDFLKKDNVQSYM